MNFFDAELVKEDGRYAVVLENARVELSEAKQAKPGRKQVQPGPITLGVRRSTFPWPGMRPRRCGALWTWRR